MPGRVLPEQNSILSFRINGANNLRLRIKVNDRNLHEENIVNGSIDKNTGIFGKGTDTQTCSKRRLFTEVRNMKSEVKSYTSS